MEKTPWYPGTINPVRTGIYEINPRKVWPDADKETAFAYWNGVYWTQFMYSIQGLLDLNMLNGHPDWRTFHNDRTNIPWRGLTLDSYKELSNENPTS